ncbi:MAG TPA: phosphoribosylanthranilate isomerase [Polyangia bacterium]
MNARNAKFARIKVGSITSLEEAQHAVAAGADAIGLAPSSGGWPASSGGISDETISAITRAVPERVGTFLLARDLRLPEIVSLQRRCGANTIQLCDPVSPQGHADLQAALPGVALVQVVRLTGRSVMAQAIAASLRANALVLALPPVESAALLADPSASSSGSPEGWALAAQIRRAVNVPVFLAGGLHATNVAAAIARVSPWGVDVGRGVRREGRVDLGLDVDDLRAFANAVRAPAVPDFVERDTGPLQVGMD